MARTARAKRYAQAVFLIAYQTGEYDRWLSDLETLTSLKSDDVFFHILETPTISFDEKARLLRDRFTGIGTMTVNLMSLLIERRLINILPGVLQEYQGLLDASRGIERAEVLTAVPLDDSEKHQLEESLGVITGKMVAITAKVEPGLIGGVVARFGGKLLDGSTRSRLEALKKDISQVRR